MNLTLSDKTREMLQRQMKVGGYRSAEEVVLAGLRCLEQHESSGDFAAGELEELLAAGDAEIERGEVIEGSRRWKTGAGGRPNEPRVRNGLSHGYAVRMRITGLILILAAVTLLLRVAWVGCWDRSLFYDTKYENTLSTTTPGATVPLKDHALLAQSARRDVNSLGLQALTGAVLALVGATISTSYRRTS
jgi:putative addiction module CopG family antidote